MSDHVTINANSLKTENIGMQTPVSQTKGSGLQPAGAAETGGDNTRDTVLHISKEAKIRLSHRTDDTGHVKKSGVTSAREVWETEHDLSHTECDYGTLFRCDAPEIYEQCCELDAKGFEADMNSNQYDAACLERCLTGELPEWASEEAMAYHDQAHQLQHDWFWSRCYDKDFHLLRDYLSGITSTLDRIYSDGEHEVSFDFYDPDHTDWDELDPDSLWKPGAKFNVLLPVDLLKGLMSVQNLKTGLEEDEKVRHRIEGVDKAVKEMKAVERDYEGDLEYLRLGVTMKEDGTATYHAKYMGCEEPDGIVADSAEELLEKLMSRS